MNKEIYRAYLKTPEWKAVRMDIINIRKCCEKCSSTHRLEVHHKSYKNVFNESPKDLMLLCRSCHKKEHSLNDKNKPNSRKRYKQFSSKVYKNIYAR